MEAKKKEHLKLERNSGLYFVIGLTLILSLAYIALEWKTFDSESDWDTSQIILNDLDEIPPLTIQQLPPPPPPKAIAPPEIKIVDNQETSRVTSSISRFLDDICNTSRSNLFKPPY